MLFVCDHIIATILIIVAQICANLGILNFLKEVRLSLKVEQV